jgi:hypothetical protein
MHYNYNHPTYTSSTYKWTNELYPKPHKDTQTNVVHVNVNSYIYNM